MLKKPGCRDRSGRPFGLFYSELGIMFAAGRTGHWWVLAAFTLFLCVVFVGMVTAVLPMAFGRPDELTESPDRTGHVEQWRYAVMATSAALLLAGGQVLASYQPTSVRNALERAAATFAGHQSSSLVAVTAPGDVVP